MGMLDRFADIVKANINELLDRAEDPAKMADQYIVDLTDKLAEVKSETANVMAEEKRAKRLVDENTAEVERYEGLAKKALAAGNEDDARAFLVKKQQLAERGTGLAEAYAAACANAEKMRQMHDKLARDIEALRARRDAIKAKVAVAETQEKVAGYASGSDRAEDALAAFDRMEAKADQMLDRADALEELVSKPADPLDELESKYEGAASAAAVDEDLARLKEEMGL